MGFPKRHGDELADDQAAPERLSSRTQATKTFEWKKVDAFLREKGVALSLSVAAVKRSA